MTDSRVKRPCRKDDPKWSGFPCNCDDCCRRAAHAWTDYVESDRFRVGETPPDVEAAIAGRVEPGEDPT
jgi:hypothetical protein